MVSCALFVIGSILASTLPRVSPAPGDSAAVIIQSQVEHIRNGGQVRIGGENIASVIVLPDFYERRRFEPAWTLTTLDSLIHAARNSQADGLDPADYHLDALLKARGAYAAGAVSAQTQAETDLIATDAVIRLGYHARFGKVDQQRIFPNWNFTEPLTDIDPVELINQAIASTQIPRAVETLLPQLPFYSSLKAMLARYRAIDASGGWKPLPAGPTLKPGVTDPRVPLLRYRLAVEDDLTASTTDTSQVFDSTLAAALARWQAHHGLEADGAVGPGTLRALNVPASARADQIRINLDRARSVMHDLPEKFVLVNVAGFTVYFVKGSWPVWESPIVVGKPYTATPIFRANAEYVVLNPTWTIPPGIMRNEVGPAMQKNPNYLAKKGYKMVDGQVVQPAGKDNALGRIKIMFPNDHSVYLHDTPAKSLFGRPERAFSHGCMRVQKPVELASLVLDDPAVWSVQALEDSIATGRTKTVFLKQKVPVLVLYWTATVGESGEIYFFDDPYKRDPPTLAALNAPFSFRKGPIIAPVRTVAGKPS